jgi:hypothetical protein
LGLNYSNGPVYGVMLYILTSSGHGKDHDRGKMEGKNT